MIGTNTKLSVLLCVIFVAAGVLAQESQTENLLDIESPNSFSYESPLSQPDSLRSRPYFDFLSTLYSHDASKTELFRQYQATQQQK